MKVILKSDESFYQCKICLSPAIYSNYGVISCSPCKMFFKRNAEITQRKFKCDFDGQCEINVDNRHMCASCRLKKCFACGMRTELIRGSRCRKNSKRRNRNRTTELMETDDKDQSHQFPILNLLQTHPAALTINQSNLLSSLILSYDEHPSLALAEQFISHQNILPFKLRFKSRSVYDFLTSLFTNAQSLFQNNPHFRSLHSQDRTILLHRQMKYLILLTSSFIAQQSHLFDYPAFSEAIDSLFGRVVLNANEFFSADVPFVKLSLTMLCFCSFDCTIYGDIPTHNLIDGQSIVEIQDMYVEVAWRYLVYVYDEEKAMMCFSNLIRYILNVVNDVMVLQERKAFLDMVNTVIEQTEQSFIRNKK